MFQSLAPGIALAQEAEPSPAPEVVAEVSTLTDDVTPSPTSTPTETPTPEPIVTETPTPTTTPTPELSPAPEATPESSITPTPTVSLEPTPLPTPLPLWTEVDGDTVTTTKPIAEGVDYRFRGTNLTVRFTKVNQPGKLTIRQIKLTPEQVRATGALTDIAYDITSDMENGSFLYDLTLPLSGENSEVDVRYASSADTLADSQAVSQNEEIKPDSITIRGLDHFTVFFVVSGEDRSSDGSLCDFLPCSLTVDNLSDLQDDDNSYLVLQNSTGGWPTTPPSDDSDRYVEFVFDPQIPDESVVASANLRIRYKNQHLDRNEDYGGELRLNSEGDNWTTIAQDGEIGPASDSSEHEYVIPLSDLTVASLNNLRARLFLYGTPVGANPSIETLIDQVVLEIDYSEGDLTGPPAPIFEFPADGQYFRTTPILNRWSAVSDPSSIREYRLEYVYDDGHTFSGAPYRTTTQTSRNHTPGITEQGGVRVRVQAIDNAGNYGDWSSWVHYYYDATAPTATISYSTTTPTNGDVIASLNPSETITVTNNGGSSTYAFLENGSFTFEFVDLAGNIGTATATVNNIDKTPPVAPNPIIPADHATIRGVAFTQTWDSIPDAVLYEYQSCFNNPDLGSPCQLKYKSTYTSPSKYVAAGQPNSHFWWRVRAKDAVGNWSGYGRSAELIIDNSSPNAPTGLMSSPNPTNSLSQNWTWNASVDSGDSGIKGYWYRVDDGPAVFIGNVLGITSALTEGNHFFYLKAEDNSGNQSAETSSTLTVDTHAPTGGTLVINGGALYTNNRSVGLDISATDNLTGVAQMKIKNSDGSYTDWLAYATSYPGWNLTDSDGEKQVRVRFKDGVGNENDSYIASDTIILDRAAPNTTISSPQPGYFNRAIRVEGTTSDGFSIDNVRLWSAVFDGEACGDFSEESLTTIVNESDNSDFGWSYDWTPPADGSYCLKAAGTDKAGNEEHSAVISGIVYDTTNPQITYADESPTDGLITNQNRQTFAVKSNEPVTACTLDFGGNGTVNTATSEITWRHTYPEDTGGSWHFYSPTNRDFVFPDRYANAGGWNQILPPVTYDMSTVFAGDQLGGTWRLSMNDHVGWDSGAITRINLTLNGTSHLWEGSAGIWDYHTTNVEIPVTGGSGGASSGNYNMTVSEDGLSAEVALDPIADGTYDYSVTCSDRAENNATATGRKISVDTVAPTAAVSYSTTEYTNGSVTATITPSESVTITNNDGSNSRVFSENGSFEFTFVDSAGNLGSATAIVGNIDTTKPQSTISSPANNGTNSIVYQNSWNGQILGTASDNFSGIAGIELSIRRTSDGLYWNGEGWAAAEESEPRVSADLTDDWSYTLPEPGEDTYEIISHAIDVAGNVEDSYKLTIVFDQTIPEVAISLNPTDPDSGNGWYKTDPEITLTATDDKLTDHIEYQWNSSSGSWKTYISPMKTPGEGNHVLYYRAYDKAGNVSGLGIKTIKYDKTDLMLGPQNVSVSPNPTSGNKATVKWEEAKDNIGIEKYEINWSLDGTSISYTDTVGNMDREHEIGKLDQEGKWNIKVTAFDSAGNRQSSSTELTVDRTAPAAPTLSLAGTSVGEASLAWTAISDARDYIVWYGNTSGNYLYGARVGSVTSFTISGLAGGDYFFIVQSVDSAGNRSGNSNEVSTLRLSGAPGIEPGTPAEGFSEQVQGASTSVEVSPTESPEAVLGENQTNDKNFPWWLIMLFVATGGFGTWVFWRRR